MKLFVKILAFICQIIVLVLIFVDKTERFEWKEIQILMVALNGFSIALLRIPSKFNDIYAAGYKKMVTVNEKKAVVIHSKDGSSTSYGASSSDDEDEYVETLGWKGLLFVWIGATIASFLVAFFSVHTYRWVFMGYSGLFLLVCFIYIIKDYKNKSR